MTTQKYIAEAKNWLWCTDKNIYCRSRIETESKKNIADKYIAVDKYDYGVQQALRAVKWHQLTIIESH